VVTPRKIITISRIDLQAVLYPLLQIRDSGAGQKMMSHLSHIATIFPLSRIHDLGTSCSMPVRNSLIMVSDVGQQMVEIAER
jgi:hypothetical protein